MSYIINPNAKNRWARNAENTMDLSLETDASSVYLDNGRTLEQEIGEGSMVSNVATIDTSMSKIIDGTLDGAYESLVFKGKSLVNLCPNKVINYTAASDWDGFNALCQNSATQESWRVLQDLKPNTKYFVSCYVETFNVGENQGYFLNNANQLTIFAESLEVKATGFHKWVLTSKSEFTKEVSIALRCQNKNARGAIKIKNIMIIEYQEGMENWDIPYFEGLCDVKMSILKSTGKNLIENLPRLSANGISIQPTNNPTQVVVNGTATNITDYYVADFNMNNNSHIFNIEVGESLTLSNSLGKKCYFGQDKNGITEWTSPSLTKKDGGTNLRCFIRFNQGDSFDNETMTVQIEQGLTATEFEPYKTNILETSNDLVLRGLPSGIRDTYDCLTGEYIRRVGERDYQESDESDSNVITDLVKTHYELAEPIVTHIEPSTTPFAYQNGHIILESGHEGQSLLPTLEYSTVINKTGQIENVAKTIQRQEKQLTMLEKMLIQNIINLDYNNTLLTLKNEMEEML